MKKIVIDKSGNYSFNLSKEGEEIDIIGRFKLIKKEKVEINLTLIHKVPKTKANISIKAVVEDEAEIIVKGRVVVEKEAEDTETFLCEKVLLLSKTAKATAIPDMEIKTNKVKCSHAATIGQIDQEQLFYLQSRGNSYSKAKYLIAEGFLKS